MEEDLCISLRYVEGIRHGGGVEEYQSYPMCGVGSILDSPTNGYIKLSCDGFMKSFISRATCGGVFWDEQGPSLLVFPYLSRFVQMIWQKLGLLFTSSCMLIFMVFPSSWWNQICR